jgi:hypothetical protein
MKIKYLLLFLLVWNGNNLFAQKEITDRTQSWYGYFNQTRFNKYLGLWLDVHFRNLDFDHPHQSMVRPGFTYYFNDNFRLTAGYTWVQNFAPEGKSVSWTEHRPWQQLWWRTKYNGFTTTQWLRLEERYVQKVVNDSLTDDYVFSNRFRYNLLVQIPLKGKELKAKTPYLAIQDELFINAGKNIVNNIFDQNRLFVGFGYYFTDHFHIQIGYMNLFQQRPSGSEFYNNHTLRVFLFHTLDFSKKETKQ